jgi:hypothetical protein
MNNLELIRKKCIEANPEIVELKEGCLVDMKGLSHTIFGKDAGKFMAYLNRPFREDLLANDFYDCEFPEGADGVTVIGRPIGLADVLLTIFSNETWKKTKKIPCILDSGRFYLITEGIEPPEDTKLEDAGHITWNLRKDDLNEQSEETISFLASLLA